MGFSLGSIDLDFFFHKENIGNYSYTKTLRCFTKTVCTNIVYVVSYSEINNYYIFTFDYAFAN